MTRLIGSVLSALLAVVVSVYAWAEMRAVRFPEQGFYFEMPERWIKVPHDIFQDRMHKMKQQYGQSGSQTNISYDFAVQLKSKDWFAYPYMLITVWEDTRISEKEIPEMNKKVKQTMLQKQRGVTDLHLVDSVYDPKRHVYLAEFRFAIKEQSMVLLKTVCYMNQGLLVFSTYLPETMYAEYGPVVQTAMETLQLSPENTYRANLDKGFDFKRDILPYSKIALASALVLLLAGIYLWKLKKKE
ncbi:MAG: hypothetical protein K9K79_05005 [Desulfohalobiaceae bacterium]|nr:hypothetical protein [Desulfohalobiaceae bacterium]